MGAAAHRPWWGIALLLLSAALQGLWPTEALADPGDRSGRLSLQAGRLTAAIAGVPLREILEDLARAVPLKVSVIGTVSDERVSATVRDEELELAIRRLLRGQSYALVHAPEAAGRGLRLAEIVVLGTADPANEPVTDGAVARPLIVNPTPTPGTGLRSSDVNDQIRTGLLIALKDPDEAVRAAALGQMQLSGGPLPVRLLGRVAHEDASPALRSRALELVAERTGAQGQAILQRALWDPDEDVREHALRLLDRVGRPDRRGR